MIINHRFAKKIYVYLWPILARFVHELSQLSWNTMGNTIDVYVNGESHMYAALRLWLCMSDSTPARCSCLSVYCQSVSLCRPTPDSVACVGLSVFRESRWMSLTAQTILFALYTVFVGNLSMCFVEHLLELWKLTVLIRSYAQRNQLSFQNLHNVSLIRWPMTSLFRQRCFAG